MSKEVKLVQRILVAFAIVLFLTPMKVHAEETEYIPVYRVYDWFSGEHFYTINYTEVELMTGNRDAAWELEGFGWMAPTWSESPVYRLCNPNNNDHHYTTSAAERDMLVANGWRYEDISWYSATDNVLPIYRQYNSNCTGAGSHNYTRDINEAQHLIGLGWRDENTAWYGANVDFPDVEREGFYYTSDTPAGSNPDWESMGAFEIRDDQLYISSDFSLGDYRFAYKDRVFTLSEDWCAYSSGGSGGAKKVDRSYINECLFENGQRRYTGLGVGIRLRNNVVTEIWLMS